MAITEPDHERYKGPSPKHLRHSCASLLLSEGRNPVEVAEIMGHSPQVLFSTYAHVISELRGMSPTSAEDQIRAARAKVAGTAGSKLVAGNGRSRHKVRSRKPRSPYKT